METTNSRNFRIDQKYFLDLATSSPLRIQRGSSQSFIVLEEKSFEAMQQEIFSLQKKLVGLMEGPKEPAGRPLDLRV